MNKYDLVISLGSGCFMPGALKSLKITEKTYPFDWSDCDGVAYEKLLKKCNLIKNHFKDAFNIEDFIEYHTPEQVTRSVKNAKTGVHYIHDFPWEKSVKDFFPEFLEKHQRRVKRLYEDVENAKNILFVYHDITKTVSIDLLKKAKDILKETFPKKNINLLVFLPCIPKATMECYEIKTNIDDGLLLYAQTNQWEKSYTSQVIVVSKLMAQLFGKDYYCFFYDDNIVSFGLSNMESQGRWSDGTVSFFRLSTMLKSKTVSVDINVIPFVNESRLNQRAKIICNGHEIKEICFDNPKKQIINLVVPNDNDGNLDFMFEFDNPQSPKELGISDDERKLALAFVDAVISEK